MKHRTRPTKLRERMVKEIRLRNFSRKTEEAYVCAVEQLAIYYNTPPNILKLWQIKDYLNHLIDEGRAFSTVNVKLCGIRFFYLQTLGWKKIDLPLPSRKRPQRLPVALSCEEVLKLINAPDNFRDRVILKTAYSTGMRLGEVTKFKVSDIESDRMLIRIDLGKGQKDRYTLLSQALLADLRAYWRRYNIENYFFPGIRSGKPLDKTTVGKIYNAAKEKAGIKRGNGIHTLRHSFATHLLDARVDIRTIQELMGHKTLATTMIYLHISRKNFVNIPNPLDLLPIDHERIKPQPPIE